MKEGLTLVYGGKQVDRPGRCGAHLGKLIEYCEIGAKEGAKLVYGGKQVDRPGMLGHIRGK